MEDIFGIIVWISFIPIYHSLWKRVSDSNNEHPSSQQEPSFFRTFSHLMRYAGWCVFAAAMEQVNCWLIITRFPAAFMIVMLILQQGKEKPGRGKLLAGVSGFSVSLILIMLLVGFYSEFWAWDNFIKFWLVASFCVLFTGQVKDIISCDGTDRSGYYLLAFLSGYLANLCYGLVLSNGCLITIYSVAFSLQLILVLQYYEITSELRLRVPMIANKIVD